MAVYTFNPNTQETEAGDLSTQIGQAPAAGVDRETMEGRCLLGGFP